MKSVMVGTRVSPKVRVEFMQLAEDLGLDTAGLLRAMIHALLHKTGRTGRSYWEEQYDED